MVITLNKSQTKQLSDYLSSMSVAWLVAVYLNANSWINIIVYAAYGIMCLVASMLLLRRAR